jgi:aminoglycoside phosphotransferase (APT) family kinase protein
LRAQHSSALLREAEKGVSNRRESDRRGPSGLVHGDLWQGNAVWDGDRLVALIDWDCAGIGPAGVDLSSLRCDAPLCFGLDAADRVLDGWAEAAGRPAEDVAHCDFVAALCTPRDIGWFAESIAGQGRPDLSRELLRSRRDEFLEAALAGSGSA